MPYKLIWETPATMCCRFSGHVDVDDLGNATNDLYNDPRSDFTTGVLWDFSAMTGFDAGRDNISEIAASDSAASRYMRPMNAAFITEDPAFSELVRHYIAEMEMFESRWTNRLFPSMEEARRWLSST